MGFKAPGEEDRIVHNSLCFGRRTDQDDKVCIMGCDSENRGKCTGKVVGRRSIAKPPGCEVMDTVGVERTRRLSEILYMSVSVSRPKRIT